MILRPGQVYRHATKEQWLGAVSSLGWKVVAFRSPETGEFYVNPYRPPTLGGIMIAYMGNNAGLGWRGCPRLIVKRKLQPTS